MSECLYRHCLPLLRLFLLASMLLALLPASAAEDPICVDQDSRLVKAYDLICDNRLPIARQYLSKLLQSHPDNKYVLNLRSFVSIHMHDYQRAINDATSILKQEPRNIDALSRRAFAYLRTKRFKAGIADLDLLLTIIPDDMASLANRGKAYFYSGMKSKSRKDIDLSNKYSMKTEVALAFTQEALTKANKNLIVLQREAPWSGFLSLCRAKCQFKLREYGAAVEYATRAMQLEPSYELQIRYLRGNAYLRQGLNTRAIEDLTSVVLAKPDVLDWEFRPFCPKRSSQDKFQRKLIRLTDVYVSRARAYLKQNQYEKAIADCNKALELDQYNVSALEVRAVAYKSSKQFEKSINDYKKAIKITHGRHDLVYILARNFQDIQAVTSGRKSLIVNLSATLQGLGEHQTAIDTLSRLIESDPKDPHVYLKRIESYMALKQFRAAVRDADSIIKLDRTESRAYKLRGDCQMMLKHFREAIGDYTSALRHGGGADVLKARSTAYSSLGNRRAAARDLELAREAESGR